MGFSEWLKLTEGSRWRRPGELLAQMQKQGLDTNRPVDRGTALSNASRGLGRNLPELQKKLGNLSWQNGDDEAAQAFQKSQQPAYFYRGHKGNNPYLTGHSVTHGSPWSSVASGYGSGFGVGNNYMTTGSRFPTHSDQEYYPDFGLSGVSGKDTKRYAGNKPNPKLAAPPFSYETEIEPDKHGSGEPVLFRYDKTAPVSSKDMNNVYKPLAQKLHDLPRKKNKDWWPQLPPKIVEPEIEKPLVKKEPYKPKFDDED